MPKKETPNLTERVLGAMAAIPVTNDAPASGFDQVHGTAADEVDDDLAYERQVAELARKLTADARPGVPAGYIDERYRDRARNLLRPPSNEAEVELEFERRAAALARKIAGDDHGGEVYEPYREIARRVLRKQEV